MLSPSIPRMERYICIHGHFYQPPRENPWLETIELQDSAYPFHDWNERITAECYAPNGASRILDGANRIVQIFNNYAWMSFNFGPTLLSWMEEKAPDVYQSILAADRESQERFSGHGSAIAQAYNHIILPLANRRDKQTQVSWGIADFEYRFRRRPEGLWLPETAVDIETLEILAAHGIAFTVLSPYQARRVRRVGEESWSDVAGGCIDPTMAYLHPLPSGRTIALFFYDGPISQAVAFEGLLRRGENLAHQLVSAFSNERPWVQLVHLGTDGETYGHHHRHGEMALAYALKYIETHKLARLTNYGEYLEKYPPTHEVEIFQQTSWSCYHGIERWRSNCGCSSGGHPDWNQNWRAPLRRALDWLRDQLDMGFEHIGSTLLKDPWAARDDYVNVIINRTPKNVDRFLCTHASHKLADADDIRVLKLLEMQRHAQLMYTSCGWFFDDISGTEAVQILQYAGRAIQLAEELFDTQFESSFLAELKCAKSNVASYRDGQHIYEQFVRPALLNLEKVGAHYAVSSVFEPYEQQTRIYCFVVEVQDNHLLESGRNRLHIGRVRIVSEITHEAATLEFGVLYSGSHNFKSGIRRFTNAKSYQAFIQESISAFRSSDLPEVLRIFDRTFPERMYSLQTLFRDEQRRILNVIIESSLQEAEAVYRQLYHQHASLIHFLLELGIPLPKGLHTAVEFVLNADFRRIVKRETFDIERIKSILEEARRARIEFDTAGLAYIFKETLASMITSLHQQPDDIPLLEKLSAIVALVHTLPFHVDLWRVQNIYYDMFQVIYPSFKAQSDAGVTHSQTWVNHFVTLGEQLGVRVS